MVIPPLFMILPSIFLPTIFLPKTLHGWQGRGMDATGRTVLFLRTDLTAKLRRNIISVNESESQ